MQVSSRILLAAILLSACDRASQSKILEAWNPENDPSLMLITHLSADYGFETDLNALPLTAQLEKKPWSDSYWPTYQGGLTHRWQVEGSDQEDIAYELKPFDQLNAEAIAVLSPAEKLDLYLGYENYQTTRTERNRTGILSRVEGHPEFDPAAAPIPTWEGLCHAWAPATIIFDEPDAVTMTSASGIKIPFTASDVKGLLSLFLHEVESPTTSFMGERCNEDLVKIRETISEVENPSEDSKYFEFSSEQKIAKLKALRAELEWRSESAECRDTNAGAFHIVLANQIALRQESFIADVTRDAEVWNQPVFAYESVVKEIHNGARPGAAPGTKQEVEIETTMWYTSEVDYHATKDAWDHEAGESSLNYHYRLELNDRDQIIGGTWLSDERPDFLWKRSKTQFPRGYEGIEAIYKASIAPKPNLAP